MKNYIIFFSYKFIKTIRNKSKAYTNIHLLNYLLINRKLFKYFLTKFVLSAGVLLVSLFDLVLEHRILSESDAAKITKKYNVPLEKFPRILKTDKMIEDIKDSVKPGQLIEIKRNDNGKKYLYYRYVIDA